MPPFMGNASTVFVRGGQCGRASQTGNYGAVVETCYQFRGRFPGHLLGKFAAVAAGQVHFVEATALTAEDLATVRQQARARVAALRR